MRVKLSADEIECANAVAIVRRDTAGGGTKNNYIETTLEQRLENDKRACRAEIAVARMLNLYWTGCGKNKDCKADVGDCVEVRQVSDSHRGLRLGMTDLARPGTPFALAQVEDDYVTFVGWEFVEDGIKSRPDLGGYVIVPRKQLRHLDELKAYVLEYLWSTN